MRSKTMSFASEAFPSTAYSFTSEETESILLEITDRIKSDIHVNEMKQLKSVELADKLVTTSR
ncbi:hypothetical protein PaecuDRAFT_3537 [Paenibacillus curdlanolyticus YK9]|uniref:Uncharacterized protein n=1 Tax=Paenibacillus curdlanolyticus YK9 TaxID=717606 RepID=E0ID35_9BACL|nr:hypothetical protein [Paenibacillus curdlanolyticus]EFM09490.1 hypothetical protein PaecuDRAFT_3537 [Paenibacillus curdlanolyticus YK9]